jgi:deoxyribonuclease-4
VRGLVERTGLEVFVHTPYLVNVGSPTLATYERSVAAIAHNLRRAVRLGARGVVVHTGSCVDEGAVGPAMRQVRAGLLPVLDDLEEEGPSLLLEPTAGHGRSLCATVEQVGPYLDALDRHPAVGICLDTCHAFAAGEPLDEPGGPTAVLDRLVAVTGPGRLRLVHSNDSKDPRGSHRDRHQRIGEGRLGLDPFRELLRHPTVAGVPFLLETPGAWDPGDAQLPLLLRLRTEALATPGAPSVRAEPSPVGAAS